MNRGGQCESLNFPFCSLLLSFVCSCHCGPCCCVWNFLFACWVGGYALAETKANSLDKPKLSQYIFVLFCLVDLVSGLHPNVNGLPLHFSLCFAVLFQSSLLLSFSLS